MISMMEKPRIIELFEYEPHELSRQELPLEAAQLIRDNCQGKISIEPTSFLPDSGWRVCSLGWVGYIPITSDLALRLSPRKGVTINNIFRMLEYAYDINSFELKEGRIDCEYCEDLYERLAAALAERVLKRGKSGYYRAYQSQSDHLSCIRGRIDMKKTCVSPWQAMPFCHFEEHTADVEENRIIAWTLAHILRSGICSDRTLPTVRQAFRRLAQSTEIMPFRPDDCVDRVYNRQNQDYEPMHALCHFFLECNGPSLYAGDRKMIPFQVNMARLYELFVSRWLKRNLPCERYIVQPQEQVSIDSDCNINFRIDLSIFDKESKSCAFVMDTKYKIGGPKTEDIEQVSAYAEAKGCKEAILVYPVGSEHRLDGRVGRIRVRSAIFSLSDDPEHAGRKFVKESLGIDVD